ncbi:hypothetical protein A3711_15865 [Erythrobacter sp. HI00D59]|nr:hypothetical protein A3711_15865 [Erythrobacter sp. HI00D59]
MLWHLLAIELEANTLKFAAFRWRLPPAHLSSIMDASGTAGSSAHLSLGLDFGEAPVIVPDHDQKRCSAIQPRPVHTRAK